MIPIADSVPKRRFAWVALALLLVNLAVFLYELSLGPAVDGFIQRWGAVPANVLAALEGDPRAPRTELLTLFTSQFLHGGWLHLGSNMLFLWVFGRTVEDRVGHLLFLLLYLAWGAGAALVQIWMSGPSPIPLIGASGAIAGVLGTYFVLYPTAWVSLLVPIFFLFWVINVPAVLALAYWFAAQFLSGVATISQADAATGGVAWWAHVGGFVLGALTALFFWRHKAVAGRLAGAGAAQPAGVMVPVAKAVSLAADALILLLLTRAGLRLLDIPGELGWVIQLIYEWSWPLVEPFSALLPAVAVLDGMVLELYTLLAAVVYAAVASAVIWLLSMGLGSRQRA